MYKFLKAHYPHRAGDTIDSLPESIAERWKRIGLIVEVDNGRQTEQRDTERPAVEEKPTKGNTKEEIKKYLRSKNVEYTERETKAQLLEKAEKEY